jgi:chaperone modulatory protein CbpM
MMRLRAVTALFSDLSPEELERWIEERWVRPEPAGEDWLFHDIDLARIRLVHDLRHEFEIAEDAVPLILGLLDQVYELRSGLKAVTRAISSQPPEIRDAIAASLETGRE